jgi:hypothetical protein
MEAQRDQSSQNMGIELPDGDSQIPSIVSPQTSLERETKGMQNMDSQQAFRDRRKGQLQMSPVFRSAEPSVSDQRSCGEGSFGLKLDVFFFS